MKGKAKGKKVRQPPPKTKGAPIPTKGKGRPSPANAGLKRPKWMIRM